MEAKDAVIAPDVQEKVAELAQKPWWETIRFFSADFQGDKSSLTKAEAEKGELVGYVQSNEDWPVFQAALRLVSLPSNMIRGGIWHYFNNTLNSFGDVSFYEDLPQKSTVEKAVQNIAQLIRETQTIEPFQFSTVPFAPEEGYLTLNFVSPHAEKTGILTYVPGQEKLTTIKKTWSQLARSSQEKQEEITSLSREFQSQVQTFLKPLLSLKEDQDLPKQTTEHWSSLILPGINQLQEIWSNLEAAGQGHFSVIPNLQNPPRGQIVALRLG